MKQCRKFFLMAVACFIVWSGCGKAKIESNCVMNGMGSGTCHFTNLGTAKGSVCGRIVVLKYGSDEKIQSPIFCSGILPKNSTNSVEFSIPDVSDFCDPGPGSYKYNLTWSKVCYFNFQESKDDQK